MFIRTYTSSVVVIKSPFMFKFWCFTKVISRWFTGFLKIFLHITVYNPSYISFFLKLCNNSPYILLCWWNFNQDCQKKLVLYWKWHWVIKVRIPKWVLTIFGYRCFPQKFIINVVEISIEGFKQLSSSMICHNVSMLSRDESVFLIGWQLCGSL